jgi:hypothetical protein
VDRDASMLESWVQQGNPDELRATYGAWMRSCVPFSMLLAKPSSGASSSAPRLRAGRLAASCYWVTPAMQCSRIWARGGPSDEGWSDAGALPATIDDPLQALDHLQLVLPHQASQLFVVHNEALLAQRSLHAAIA